MTEGLLTGAGGWFGHALLDLLDAADLALPKARWTVVLGPDDDPGLDSRWSRHGTVRRGSLLDPSFTAALPVADLLLHAAAVIHPEDSLPAPLRPTERFPLFEQNVEMFAAALGRCTPSAKVVLLSSSAALGVGVFPSSPAVSPHALLGYADSKRRCEALLEGFCAVSGSAAVVRAFWFYGPSAPPRQARFDSLARRGLFPLLNKGRHLRSTSRVDDVARACVAALGLASPGCPRFFVADPVTRTMGDLCRVRRQAGSRHVAYLPQWLGSLARRLDAWVQRRGGYVQNLHVFAELADPIAISSETAMEHRRMLGLSLDDAHLAGVAAERGSRPLPG